MGSVLGGGKPDTSAQDAANRRQEKRQAEQDARLAREEQAEKKNRAASDRLARSKRAGRAQTLFENTGSLGAKDTLG